MAGPSMHILDHRVGQPDAPTLEAEVDLRIWSAVQYLFVGLIVSSVSSRIIAWGSVAAVCIYKQMLAHKATWKEREIIRIVNHYVKEGYDLDEIENAFGEIPNSSNHWQQVISHAHLVALPAMMLVSHFWMMLATAVVLGAAEITAQELLREPNETSLTTARALASSMPNIHEVVRCALIPPRILSRSNSALESKQENGKEEEEKITNYPEPFTPLQNQYATSSVPGSPLKRPRPEEPRLSPIPHELSPMFRSVRSGEVKKALSDLQHFKERLLEADSKKLEELECTVANLQAQFAPQENPVPTPIASLHKSILEAKDETDPEQRKQILRDIQGDLDRLPAQLAAYRDPLDTSVASIENDLISRMDALAESFETFKTSRGDGEDNAILDRLDKMYGQLCQLADSYQSTKPTEVEQLKQLYTEQTECLKGLQEQLQKLHGSEETLSILKELQTRLAESNFSPQKTVATDLTAILEAIKSLKKHLVESRDTIPSEQDELEELNQTIKGLQTYLSVPQFDSKAEDERSALHGSLVQLQESICLAKNATDPEEKRKILHAIQNNLDQMPARFAEYRRVLDQSIASMNESLGIESIDELLGELREKVEDPETSKSLSLLHERLHQEASFSKSSLALGSPRHASDHSGALILPTTDMLHELHKVAERVGQEPERTHNLVLALQLRIANELLPVESHHPYERESTSLKQQLADLQLSLKQLFQFVQAKEETHLSEFQKTVQRIMKLIPKEEHHTPRLKPAESSESGQTKIIEDQLAAILDLVQNPVSYNTQFTELENVVKALKQEIIDLKAPTLEKNPQLEEIKKAIATLHLPQKFAALKEEIDSLRACLEGVQAQVQETVFERVAGPLTQVQQSLEGVVEGLAAMQHQQEPEEIVKLQRQINSLESTLQTLIKSSEAQVVPTKAVSQEQSKVAAELAQVRQSLEGVVEGLAAMHHQQEPEEIVKLQRQINSLENTLQTLIKSSEAQVVPTKAVSQEQSKIAAELAQVRQSLEGVVEGLAAMQHQQEPEEIVKLQRQINSLENTLQRLIKSSEAQVVPTKAVSQEHSNVAAELAQVRQSLAKLVAGLETQRSASSKKTEATLPFVRIKEAIAAKRHEETSEKIAELQEQVINLSSKQMKFIEMHMAGSDESSQAVAEQLAQFQQLLLELVAGLETQRSTSSKKTEATSPLVGIKEAIAAKRHEETSEKIMELQEQISNLSSNLMNSLETRDVQQAATGIPDESSQAVAEQLAQVQQLLLELVAGSETQRSTSSKKTEATSPLVGIKEAIAAKRHEETSEKITELQEQISNLSYKLMDILETHDVQQAATGIPDESSQAVAEQLAQVQQSLIELTDGSIDTDSHNEKLRRVITSLTSYITISGQQFKRHEDRFTSLSKQLGGVSRKSSRMMALMEELKSSRVNDEEKIKSEINRLSTVVSANTETLTTISETFADRLLTIQSAIDELRTEERCVRVTEGFQQRLGNLESQLDALLRVPPSNETGGNAINEVASQLDALDKVVTGTVGLVKEADRSETNHHEQQTDSPLIRQKLKERRHTISTGLAAQLVDAETVNMLPEQDHRRLSRVVEIISSIPQTADPETGRQESQQIKMLERQHAFTTEFLKRMNESIDQKGVGYDIEALRKLYKNQVFYARFWKTTFFSTFTILKGLPLHQPDAHEDGHEADSMQEEDLHKGILNLMPEIIEWKGALDSLLLSKKEEE